MRGFLASHEKASCVGVEKKAGIIANSKSSLGGRDPTVQDLAPLQTKPDQGQAKALFSSPSSLGETIFTEIFQRPDLDSRETL